ncbi:xanthine dehydrogenase family protein subunit M [Variovorax paradoxus]|nr:xanthine dehydrogenase family protein subunit M [Variovorax paradoxus]MBT2302740.1 xanthine dehydrogenase family protein subunit M [Variovorax paradoxus]
MNPFEYHRATDAGDALRSIGGVDGARFIAGGTNLLDLMKEGVARPARLVDITHLPLREVRVTESGGLHVGALVRNADLAWHPEVQRRYPLLAEALLAGASPQLRNMATVGGNLLQRTRCYYFYDIATPCNKRAPGSGCPAIEGLNRIHAILGTSEQCVAVHPSDMCVALAALEAVVHVQGPQGERSIAMADFHRLPGDAPERDTTLAADELVTAVELPADPFARHSCYLKLRDRRSYAFALVSAACALDIAQGRIRSARIALGGVAHKPWRRPEADALLAGQVPAVAAFEAAAAVLVEGARALEHNGFKIELARRTVVRALMQAAGMEAAA